MLDGIYFCVLVGLIAIPHDIRNFGRSGDRQRISSWFCQTLRDFHCFCRVPGFGAGGQQTLGAALTAVGDEPSSYLACPPEREAAKQLPGQSNSF